MDKNLHSVFHWTDAGVASWYAFAVAIQEESIKAKLLENTIPIMPVAFSQYPTPAQKPMYSVLDKPSFWRRLEKIPVYWRMELRRMVRELTSRRPKQRQ